LNLLALGEGTFGSGWIEERFRGIPRRYPKIGRGLSNYFSDRQIDLNCARTGFCTYELTTSWGDRK
jgi:hypothetical protein